MFSRTFSRTNFSSFPSKPLRFPRFTSKNLFLVRSSLLFRSFSTAASTTLPLRVEKGIYTIKIQLAPNEPTHIFALRKKEPIRNFISDLMTEDRTIKSVAVFGIDGHRIAKSTPIAELLEHEWKLRINDVVYNVRSPPRSKVGNYHISVPDEVLNNPTFKSLQERLQLKAGTVETIPYDKYLSYCQELNIDEPTASRYLQYLHQLGTCFHFSDRKEISSTIFLHPEEITKLLDSALNLNSMTKTPQQRAELLRDLEAELIELNRKFVVLDRRASRFVSFVSWSGFFGLCVQFALFARLTWWDLSWDVMEPVTYFTTVTESVVAAYVFYLVTKGEFSFVAFRRRLYEWRLENLASKEGFDLKRLEQVKNEIHNLKEETEIYNDKAVPALLH